MTITYRKCTLPDMTKIRIPVCICNVCGHEWVPRKPEPPRRCAACKSPYWDRPKAS